VQEIPAMNVSLTPELDEFVAAKVKSGRYTSASEVVREALRLLEEHDRSRAEQIAAFNRELGRRLAAADQGPKFSSEEIREHFHRKSAEFRKLRA
jgi:antitoxin ParD1/3/4